METVLITGGTGLVGKPLCSALTSLGYSVHLLSRKPVNNPKYATYFWDPESKQLDQEVIDEADYIIHLAGENIGAKRWTATRKQQVLDSRVQSGELLFQKIQASKGQLKAFISASAIGYYGAVTSENIFSEQDSAGDDFLGSTCHAWEQVSRAISSEGIRTVTLRMGVVLAANGGALPKMIFPVKYGFGSALGSGDQYMSWIHMQDIIAIIIKALQERAMSGIYNAVSPQGISNRVFMKTLAAVLRKPFIMPAVPSFVIRSLIGEMSDMILKGSRVSGQKLIHSGYTFLFPEIEGALKNILTEAHE